MSSPHLPPKVDNPQTAQFFQRLKWFVFIIVMSVLAGASGASMILGWIWPRFAEGDTWINSYTRPGLSRAQLESLIREEMTARIVRVYRGATSVASVQYFNKKVGDGVMVSSDGWLALYQPSYDGVYKNLYIVDSSDHVYAPEDALWDKQSGFLFIKINNSQFNKVVEFVDENSLADDIFVWQYENWHPGSILYPVLSGKIPHTDTAPIRQYSLGSEFESGAIAINKQGRVVGFISEKNTLLPALTITRVLGDVLNKQLPTYASLGVDGWFSEEQVIFSGKTGSAQEKIRGFFVSAVWSPGNLLRKGDVITEINNRVVVPDNLWYTVSNAASVKAKVLRNGKIVELNLKVVQTK
jgi:hypothetical protein